jgi:molybdopterin converting factor small subunit
MRVTDVLKTVQERYPDLALSGESFLITVNDRVARMDQILNAKDRISFLPHIGGG